jgi:hypothetical protein
LIIGLILPYDQGVVEKLQNLGVSDLVFKAKDGMFYGIVAVCVVGLAWSVWQSKRETSHND